MHIGKFQVTNFKSYRDSTVVDFKPGFNIITGQNSAGKTALLEALTVRFGTNPNRSLKTVPVPGISPDGATSVLMTLVIDGPELVTSLQSMGAGPWLFPTGTPNETHDAMNQRLLELVQRPELHISFRRVVQQNGAEQWTMTDPLFLGVYRPVQNTDGNWFAFGVVPNTAGLTINVNHQLIAPGSDVRHQLVSWLRGRIYRFKAERFNVGAHVFGANPVLAQDAANLPEVLTVLNGNPARFDQLNMMVSEILPQVRRVSVRPLGDNRVEIQVWPHDYKTERADLAIPLNECGSGVGQVLAILYLVLTSDHPQVIIIDEPQSFLHPGAVRKLIEVLKKYPQHQYIFATHSPAVITASDPSTFTMVRARDGESVLEIMDPKNAKHLQSYLSEIGARLSDVFGADNILWAEGQTEEECFPLILTGITRRPLMGTAVVGIRQTGDLQGRDKRRVLEMYRRLSEARTLLPPPIAFVFDQECLTREQKEELHRMDPGSIHFLPRRMYENYLLSPAALAAVMNGIENFRDVPITEEEVSNLIAQKRQQLLDQRGRDLLYFCRGTVQVPEDWVRQIDAATLLKDVFQELSGNRVSYEKTTHSVALTEWLIGNSPAELGEIADFLNQLLPRSN